MAVNKTIAVFGPDNTYLSNCTWKRALGLIEAGKAIKLNDASIILKQSKRERIKHKHNIIAESKRVCYICNRRIPESETATIDHVIPKSRNKRADTYANMRCCCERCNNDKGNMTLSEYVRYIKSRREKYDYISDKRLKYLKNFAKYYEEEFYSNTQVHIDNHKNNRRKGKRK